MNKGKTIFAQVISLINTYEFNKCVNRYKGDRHAIKFTCRASINARVIPPPILCIWMIFISFTADTLPYLSAMPDTEARRTYLYAFRHGIETLIKYNYFHKE